MAEPVGVDIASLGCELTGAPKSVTIAVGKKQATLSVPTGGAGVGTDGCAVTAKIKAGAGYQVGAATAASASGTLTQPATPDPPDPATPMQPEVTIAPTTATVSEGIPVSFRLTAEPAPEADLTVNVSWSENGSFLAATRPKTVTIGTSGTGSLTADTVDDSDDEEDGSVTATVEAGTGYAVGTPASATVEVTDDDPATTGGGGGAPPVRFGCRTDPCPDVSVAAITASVTEGDDVSFTFTASPTPASDLTVNLFWPAGYHAPRVTVGDLEDTVTISSSGTATVTVATIDDTAPNYSIDGTGDFYLGVQIHLGPGYTVGAPEDAEVLVQDDEQ